MKTLILAGGFGTRISEETDLKPKPMIQIGGKPILWHIMKMYSKHGMNDFVILLGYKGHVIKEFFSNYFLYQSDVTFDMSLNKMEIHNNSSEPWKVTLIDTGSGTMTGGRLKRVEPYLDQNQPFCFTYGDGLADVDITKLVQFHENHGKLATVTAVFPPGRYGAIQMDDSMVTRFQEKPNGDGSMINGGFFVLSPKVLSLIDGDEVSWEGQPLFDLVKKEQLMSFEHRGFWQPMDTLREKTMLQELWDSGEAPWKIWN